MNIITKTQEKIIEIFLSKLNNKFSINEVSGLISKPYAHTYNSIKDLIERKLVIIDERKLLSLNILNPSEEFFYAEAIRTRKRLNKHKSVSMFVKDCINQLREDFFVFLIFGSFVEKDKFNDVDFLIIFDEKSSEKMELIERHIETIASKFSFKSHILAINKESFYEMAKKKEENNVINETLNKHLILFGSESYYRLLKNVRK